MIAATGARRRTNALAAAFLIPADRRILLDLSILKSVSGLLFKSAYEIARAFEKEAIFFRLQKKIFLKIVRKPLICSVSFLICFVLCPRSWRFLCGKRLCELIILLFLAIPEMILEHDETSSSALARVIR